MDIPPQPSASESILDRREHFQKKFKNFNGVPPHQREKKPNSSYPTVTDEEVTSTRAVIAYLLAREYGFSITDIFDILRCEDGHEAEKLLAVGDNIAVDSKILARMQSSVLRAAQQIIAAAAPFEEQERLNSAPPKRKPKTKVKPSHARRPTAERSAVRCLIAYFLAEEYGFPLKNIQPILGYPTREQLRMLIAKGKRLLLRCSPRSDAGARMLAAAKVIVGKATEPG